MSEARIDWDKPARKLASDPAATIALDRAAWEALGAAFTELDDGQGETPGLATAKVTTSRGEAAMGILDYGESSTYLLIPAAQPERFATTAAVLELLESLGALDLGRDLLDLADQTPLSALAGDVRVAYALSGGEAGVRGPSVSLASEIGALRTELALAHGNTITDIASALATITSILAIVNGLALTNTLLVLVTGGRYAEVIPLTKIPIANVAFAVVLMANIVRFYLGNVRHLDTTYRAQGVARPTSGRYPEPRLGLGVDFCVIFIQSSLFALMSFYVGSHSEYLSLILVLLVLDILWTVYSQKTMDRDEGAVGTRDMGPQRLWLLNNLMACVGLVAFFQFHRSHPTQAWPLSAALAALAASTVTDFAVSWKFYFPASSPTTDEPPA
jgi:hypothetical protein